MIKVIMRSPTRKTADELHLRYTGSLRKLADALGLDASKTATLSRILRRASGVSRATENEIREALGMEPLARKPRTAMGFDPEVARLFQMERDRRNLTNTQMLASLLGLAQIGK